MVCLRHIPSYFATGGYHQSWCIQIAGYKYPTLIKAENTYLNLNENMSGHMAVQLDDITGEHVAMGLMSSNVTPEILPNQLCQQGRRGQNTKIQYWIETQQPFTEDWVNDRTVFHDCQPPNLAQTRGVWTPSMPPMACTCIYFDFIFILRWLT
jgi:hypothetical protein